MRDTLTSINTSDSHTLYFRQWDEVENDKKIVMILVHGMTEHSYRYEEFAHFLNQNGIAVFALDLRGHGNTGKGEERGWYAEENGWMRTALDVIELTHMVKSLNKYDKFVLFGHSMGSYLSREIISSFPNEFDAAVLSGTGMPTFTIKAFGPMVSAIERKRIGAKTPSTLMNKLSFASFNKHFEEKGKPSNGFEWLNRDEKEVQKYIDDPDCGFVCTSSFFYDFIRGMIHCTSKKAASKVRKDLPILFVSGDEDPVGNFSKGVISASRRYIKAGVEDVTVKLYPGARHEIVFELCKGDVMRDVLSFIDEKCAK